MGKVFGLNNTLDLSPQYQSTKITLRKDSILLFYNSSKKDLEKLFWCKNTMVVMELIKKQPYKITPLFYYDNISINLSSDIIDTPKEVAFSNFAGPILSPATIKVVFFEIELETFPPLSSIDFFNSLRDIL